jgi:hypothetical protein
MLAIKNKEIYEQHIIIILGECCFCIERCDEVMEMKTCDIMMNRNESM